MFEFFVQFYFDEGVHLQKEIVLLQKRHLLYGDRVKMLANSFLDLCFEAAPDLGYIFQFFELRTNAAFAKAAFDTLSKIQRCAPAE